MYDGRFSNNSWLQVPIRLPSSLGTMQRRLATDRRDLEIPESSQIGKTETSLITLTVNGQSVEMPLDRSRHGGLTSPCVGYGRIGLPPYHENGTVGFDVTTADHGWTRCRFGGNGQQGEEDVSHRALAALRSQTPGFGYPARALVRETTVSFGFAKSVDQHRSDPRPSTFGQATVTSQSLARSSIVTLQL